MPTEHNKRNHTSLLDTLAHRRDLKQKNGTTKMEVQQFLSNSSVQHTMMTMSVEKCSLNSNGWLLKRL
jgi:hypothetical protein